jgi:hypothetical protein
MDATCRKQERVCRYARTPGRQDANARTPACKCTSARRPSASQPGNCRYVGGYVESGLATIHIHTGPGNKDASEDQGSDQDMDGMGGMDGQGARVPPVSSHDALDLSLSVAVVAVVAIVPSIHIATYTRPYTLQAPAPSAAPLHPESSTPKHAPCRLARSVASLLQSLD